MDWLQHLATGFGVADSGVINYINKFGEVRTSKLLKDFDDSLKKGGGKHSPSTETWTDKIKNLFS